MDSVWVGVGINIVLVLVTAVYAYLTHKLAASSKAAAAASAEAAKSAAESARHQAATVEADANRRYAWFKTGGGGGPDPDFWEFGVTPLVGAYVLHEVVLRRFSFIVDDQSRSFEPNLPVEPRGRSFPLPVDEVEGAMFEIHFSDITEGAHEAEGWKIEDWELMVVYSHSRSSGGTRRVLVHLHPERDGRFRWIREAREMGIW